MFDLAEQVGKLFSSCLNRYRHQQLDEAQRYELKDDWVRLASQLGYATFAEALEQARLVTDFIPTPNLIRECAGQLSKPSFDGVEVLGKRPSHSASCACGGTGWVNAGNNRFGRCQGTRTAAPAEKETA